MWHLVLSKLRESSNLGKIWNFVHLFHSKLWETNTSPRRYFWWKIGGGGEEEEEVEYEFAPQARGVVVESKVALHYLTSTCVDQDETKSFLNAPHTMRAA